MSYEEPKSVFNTSDLWSLPKAQHLVIKVWGRSTPSQGITSSICLPETVTDWLLNTATRRLIFVAVNLTCILCPFCS